MSAVLVDSGGGDAIGNPSDDPEIAKAPGPVHRLTVSQM
jgi:hypothetical protein